jgi:hypothetical protein
MEANFLLTKPIAALQAYFNAAVCFVPRQKIYAFQIISNPQSSSSIALLYFSIGPMQQVGCYFHWQGFSLWHKWDKCHLIVTY